MRSDLFKAPDGISVGAFVQNAPSELGIRVLAGESGLETRTIVSDRVQKLGLALTGFTSNIHTGRVQIFGSGEQAYLSQLSPAGRGLALGRIEPTNICCILVTNDQPPPAELVDLSQQNGLPLLQTSLPSSKAIANATEFLQEELAPQVTIHAAMLDILGVGVILAGDSGAGKSECALELVSRGHRLISDDAVVLRRVGKRLAGSSPGLTRGLLEIRGLGIVNVRDLFGISAIAEPMSVTLFIELRNWENDPELDRLGLERPEEDLLGIKVRKYIIPVNPGRNLSVLVETAVRLSLHGESGERKLATLLANHAAVVANE